MDDNLGAELEGSPIYTIERAQAVLGHVCALLERLRRLLRAYGAGWMQDPQLSRLVSANGHASAERPDMDVAVAAPLNRVPAPIAEVTAIHDELTRLGVLLRDPMRGLIDLHHRRDGRIVYLCYLLGEERLAFWHELDAGFGGRQPL